MDLSVNKTPGSPKTPVAPAEAKKLMMEKTTGAVADSTPSVIPALTKNVAPINVDIPAVVTQIPTIVSPPHSSAAVTSTSTTPVVIPQTSALPSSKTKKRKADTTTPGNQPSEQPPVSKAAKIPSQHGSTRPIKEPTLDLPELPRQEIKMDLSAKKRPGSPKTPVVPVKTIPILMEKTTIADSTPSVIPALTKDVAPVNVDMPAVVTQTPTIVSLPHSSAAVTSTSTTPIVIPQTSAVPSSKTKKRKADATTPGDQPSEQPSVSKAAKIPSQHGSTRLVEKPRLDLLELSNQGIKMDLNVNKTPGSPKTSVAPTEVKKSRRIPGLMMEKTTDFARTLPWLHRGRHYLQGSRQDFIDLLLLGDNQDGRNTVKSDPAELIETAKRTLAKGELAIAEIYSINAIRTAMFDNSCKRSPEPYRYLAEVQQRKAENKNLQLPKRQLFLLQAAALYNFVLNYLKTEDVEDELSKTLSKVVSPKLSDIQDNMVEMVGGNPLHCKFDSELKKNQLKNLRDEIKQSFESMECRMSSNNTQSSSKCDMRQTMNDVTEEIKGLSDTISVKMKEFLTAIIKECLELLGTPPCYYEVIVLGSLARNEMTPYSDFEWAILTESEEEKCKVFFRNLTNLVHLQIINLGETILPSMNIKAINEEWFYDDKTAKGVSFDGFFPQACKTPLGNMPLGNTPEFELIHTPKKMADFQNNDWYRENWKLGDTLLTVSPLQPDKHRLVDAYRKEMAKILSCPCDSECCKKDDSYGACLTRGSCRGMRTLCEDVSRYGDVLTGNNASDDGKLYDVKKEIYRITDRVFAALAKCYEVDANGTFAILDELYRREIISSEARDYFASASAIAIKLRVSTYLKAGKQGEQLMASSNEEIGKFTSGYFMPKEEELIHFFRIATPLYEELQKMKTVGNIPQSLTHTSFYDGSDVTMGHIHCRLLKYDEALKCYKRSLQQDPENLSTEIRRISIALCIKNGTEEMDKIRENLDALLCKIDQSWSKLHPETILAFVDRLNFQEMWQLLEVLLLASSYFGCPKYSELGGNILHEDATKAKYGSERNVYLVLMIPMFTEYKSPKSHVINFSNVLSFINEEGVSTKSILLLNMLGKLLCSIDNLDKAYNCFQRALTMERLLYQTKPNMNMMTTLFFLGLTSFYLSKSRESKFYFESYVQLFESFGRPGAIAVKVKTAYYFLARVSEELGDSAKERVCYLEKGLKETTGSQNDGELCLDCNLYLELATVWHAEHNHEEASKFVLKGKACLRKIVGINERVLASCDFAEGLAEIQKINEGIEILKEEVQVFTSPTKEKALCLMKLGKLRVEQGLASDAENYYKQALEILVEISDKEDTVDICKCRIGISKAIMMDNRVSEAEEALDEALDLAIKLPAQPWYFFDMGWFCEDHGYMTSARKCFNEGLKLCEKLSSVAKESLFTEINLALSVGEILGKSACAIDSVNSETAIQAQRSYLDRAAEKLRQLVATQEVDANTVIQFLLLALQYKSIDVSETIKLMLEALEIQETVERKKLPLEKTCEIMKKLLSWKISASDKEKISEFISKREGTLAEDSKTSDNCSNDRKDVELFIPTSDDVKRPKIDCSDAIVQLLSKAVFQINLPVDFDSFFYASLISKSSKPNLEEKQIGLCAHIDALEYNRRKGNVLQAAKIHAFVEARQLSLNENCSYDDVQKRINDAIRTKEANDPSSCIRSLDLVLRLASNWKQKTKALKLRGDCYLSKGDFRTAAINFNEAVRVYSNDTVGSCDDMRGYLEVAIGLIKAEMLCQNIAVAWYRYCVVEIRLVFYHEHEEFVTPQMIELHYLGAKCLYILLEIAESKDNELFSAVVKVCEKAILLLFTKVRDLQECKPLFLKVVLLLVAVKRKLHGEEKADEILERLDKLSINTADQFEFNFGFKEGFSELDRLLFSGIPRMLVERGEIKQSIACLTKSLRTFFSAALPDMLSFYEELLPLLQAITVTKFSGSSRESRSLFLQQAVDMCKDVLVEQDNELNVVYELLKTLANLYMALGRTEEAIVVAEYGLKISGFIGDNTDRINNRARMLLYLAQIHQINSTNSAFDGEKELDLAEQYYKKDQDSAAEFVLQKNLSYANFLCEQKRFAEAYTVLQDMDNLGKELSNKSVYCTYFSRVFYGPGILKSVDVDGELLSTVEHCMYSTMVRVFVGSGKKREAVAACEKLADNPVVVHDAIHGKRPSSIPYLIEACHRELLSLLSDEDQKRFQNCEFPLSPANIFELYYRLNEYSLALKYYPNETKSPELMEKKISCLRLAGNELVELGRGNESYSYFTQFLEMLQIKEGFLDKSFDVQCAILAGYFFANQYYIFRSLGRLMSNSVENLDGAIQCYERCFELDKDLSLGQEVVTTLVDLYQSSKTLTVYIENQESFKRRMKFAFDLFQKLLQKFGELPPSIISYLIQVCPHCKSSLSNDGDQILNSKCTFSPDNIFEFYYMLTEYSSSYVVETLDELSKTLTVDKENVHSCRRFVILGLDSWQKMLEKNDERTPYLEYMLGSALLKTGRYDRAVGHFENVINKAGYQRMYYGDDVKLLVDVYLLREIEASGNIRSLVKVGAFYQLILAYMELNEVGKAQEVALRLENFVGLFKRVPETSMLLSIVGYANKVIGNKQKAAEIFLSVLEIKPGHLPVAEALESLCL